MIYLDNNATTRIDEHVLNAMMPYFRESYGNASSTQHRLGRQSNEAIQLARQQIARALKIQDPNELIFTSGATEAINIALKGVATRYHSIGNHIITCQTEHKAVLETCAQLEKEGCRVTYLPVLANGQIDLAQLREAITPETILISLMTANNETGVLHPIADIAQICQQHGILFFCDATQYIGKQNALDLAQIPVDLLCLSAHKFHGPKGVGALYIRRRKSKPIQIEPLIVGGNQEGALRGGTYNVPAIVGFGAALEHLQAEEWKTVATLRDYLETSLLESIPHISINGADAPRLSNTSNLTIKHVLATELISRLPDIAFSTGSACVVGSAAPSHVLIAMGLSEDMARCSIRLSLSKYTTREEIAEVAKQIANAVKKIRAQSPVWMLFEKGLID
ncbi:cysteine desulfurase family protein [Sphingobacterium corticibacter]|uniref:cysteine desulfurase n=1 Tax=Sphingobacterium corticibacter TaxID=2171749 RepID=A0A2T8HGU3_9SPHI|nr:cysteine desulfurase family protein [Sphingobacterium corticibacter]PVH24613.1 IscS subfamily cysteine desulfurase [Sphingobacterium corticibacter]